MDSRKPLTAGVEELIGRIETALALHNEGGPLASTPMKIPAGAYRALVDAKRLLSLLTPPPDAAVREAVEELERKLAWLRSHPKEESANVGIVQLRIDLDILLSYVRAVQAPRLTPEQVEAIQVAASLLKGKNGDRAWARRKLDAAFPEAFAGEVDRG